MYEETARAGVALRRLRRARRCSCLPYIKMLATDEQKKRFLPKFVSGEEMWAHRDDRAGHRLRPRGHEDHRQALRGRHATTSSTAPRPSSPAACTPTA